MADVWRKETQLLIGEPAHNTVTVGFSQFDGSIEYGEIVTRGILSMVSDHDLRLGNLICGLAPNSLMACPDVILPVAR